MLNASLSSSPMALRFIYGLADDFQLESNPKKYYYSNYKQHTAFIGEIHNFKPIRGLPASPPLTPQIDIRPPHSGST